MVIKWTPLARKSLNNIYLFYLPETGRSKAIEIITRIKEETKYLLIFPQLGANEFINDIKLPNRYIIRSNCKIYYTIKKKYIRIDLVWDTRQDTQLLEKLLK